MSVLNFIGARLLYAIPVLIGVTVIVFLSLQLVPGDIALTLLGRMASEADLEALRERLGLNQPLIVQYVRWLLNLLQGDIGNSVSQQLPVMHILGPKVVNSLILMAGSLVLVLAVGFILSVLSSSRFRSITDRSIVGLTLILASLPVFWLGIVLLYFFGFKWKLFPISGMMLSGTGRDFNTSIINGRIVMRDRQLPGIDLDEYRKQAQAQFERLITKYPMRTWRHPPVEEIFLPSFPFG